MSPAPAQHAVIVDRDPLLLSRLASELAKCGYATETLSSTLGLTPDLLELSGPNLLLVDAELPGMERSALQVIVRSLKARRQTRVIVSTTQDPALLSRVAADKVVRRSDLTVEGIRALGIELVSEAPLDLKALLDEVLGRQIAGPAPQLSIRLDLFSKSNLYVFARDSEVSGVFFATSVLLPLGQKVQVSLDLLGRSKIESAGEILWQRPHSSFGGRVATGVGIRLLELGGPERELIRRFVDVREPLVWSG